MSLSHNAPGRCFHCGSVLVYAAMDCKFICTNAMCKKEQPGVPSEAEVRAADARPKFSSWPCHRTPGNQCNHHDCYQHLDHIPAGPLRFEPEEKVVVGNFGGDPYKVNQQMADEIMEVVNSYQGRVALASAIGVLEILKINLWSKHNG